MTVGIVGGGPAGLATALALREQNVDVLVIEGSMLDRKRPGEHLLPDALPKLEALGATSVLRDAGYRASAGVASAWGSGTLERRSYIFNPYGHAWNLSRPEFDLALARIAAARGARVRLGTRLVSRELIPGGWRLTLRASQETLTADVTLLVDATGRRAGVARANGAKRISVDRLVGVVRRLPGSPKDASVLVEACADGWWYSAPVPSGTVAAFMTDADRIREAGRDLPELWREQLRVSPHTYERLAECGRSHNLRVVSAASGTLDACAGDGWIAVGDAAMTVDPLSSTGLLKALDDGLRAGRAVAACMAGDADALNGYAREMRESFDQYLATRDAYYALERRWPEQPFWFRRRSLDRVEIDLDPEARLRTLQHPTSRTD